MLATLVLWRKWNINFAGMRESLFCFVLINWHGGRIIEVIISQQLANRKGVRESRPCVSRDGTGMTMVMQRSSAGAQERREKKSSRRPRAGGDRDSDYSFLRSDLMFLAHSCRRLTDRAAALDSTCNKSTEARMTTRLRWGTPTRRHNADDIAHEVAQPSWFRRGEKQLDSLTRRLKRKQAVARARGEKNKTKQKKVTRIVAEQTQQTCKGACTVLCVAAERFQLTRQV